MLAPAVPHLTEELWHAQGAVWSTWVVRGFGTAIMHGGATAIVAMIGLAGATAVLLNIGRNTYLTFHALHHGSKSLERDLAGVFRPGHLHVQALLI